MGPDLNLIGHVWDDIQKAVNGRQSPVTTLQELDMVLHKDWNQMPQQHVAILFNRWGGSARQSYRLAEDMPTTDAPVTLQWTF